MEFIDNDKMSELRSILQELLDLDDGLSPWTLDFIDSLANWDGAFTERQGQTLENIYKETRDKGLL